MSAAQKDRNKAFDACELCCRAEEILKGRPSVENEIRAELKAEQSEEEQRRLEPQRQQNQKLESLGILAGGIAHDFNNLMSGVFGCIAMALKSMEQGRYPDAVAYLTRALGVSERAKALSRQLLTFMKDGATGRKTMSLTPLLNENPVFALSGSNVKAVINVPDDLWTCNVDENQINQVIDNMVINARQAMPDGGTVYVSAENLPAGMQLPSRLAPGRYVRIIIRDEGPGVSPENIDRVFDPFFTTKQTGSGIGLAVSSSIISKHDGLITVESGRNKGAIFSIYLPACTGEVVEPPVEKAVPGVKNGKILFMDDEDYIRIAVGGIIDGMGFTACFARDGSEAIKLFTEAKEMGQPFDVVILDLTVQGGMGGAAAAVELHSIDPAVKAIASSGFPEDDIMMHPVQYGFVDKLEKPYTGEYFENILHKVMAPA